MRRVLVANRGRKAGTFDVTTTRKDVKYVLKVLENGRGPEVEASFRLANDGTPGLRRGARQVGRERSDVLRVDGRRPDRSMARARGTPQCGIPAADVLRMATLGSARAMKQDKVFGTVAPGKRADLVVVGGDPLADITAVRKVVSTMRAGVIYEAQPLLAALSVKPWSALVPR
jgi:hypothetical protein